MDPRKKELVRQLNKSAEEYEEKEKVFRQNGCRDEDLTSCGDCTELLSDVYDSTQGLISCVQSTKSLYFTENAI